MQPPGFWSGVGKSWVEASRYPASLRGTPVSEQGFEALGRGALSLVKSSTLIDK